MISLLCVLQININLSELFFESTQTPLGQDPVKNELIISGFRGLAQSSNSMLSRGSRTRAVEKLKHGISCRLHKPVLGFEFLDLEAS